MSEKQPRLSPGHKKFLHDIGILPKRKRSLLARSEISAVDDTMATTFSTGRWFNEMTAFRSRLKAVAEAKK